MPFVEPTTTSQRILNVAESLFAQHGHAGVSLRQITAQAKVNLAAVNYHYYDKETLYRELLQRRLRQINRRRLDLLAEAELRAGDGPTSLTEIFDALARPFIMADGEYSATSARLLGRMLTEQQPFIEELLRTEFQPVMTRFGQAVRRHAPSLTPADFLWRFSLVIGALHHAMATIHCMKSLTNGICRDDDPEGALRNFTEFAVRAFGRGA
jgi:AcrR family transcriptional regulator